MATKDVEMTDTHKDAEKATEKPKLTPQQEAAALLIADLKKHISLLEKSVSTKETRYTARVLRTLSLTRRRVTVATLKQFVEQTLTSNDEQKKRNELLAYLSKVKESPDTQEIAMDISKDTTQEVRSTSRAVIPEVEAYVHLLVTVFLIDRKCIEEAMMSSTSLVNRLATFNRRTLNALQAKAFFYYFRSFELAHRLEEIRPTLLASHRTATLRHNDESQAMLLNLLLRNYLEYNLYDQADKLVSKTTFREDAVSSNQHARYLYYQGKIKSIQLDYTDAYRCLLGAIRKAPAHSARGFRTAVTKLSCIVQLLMGEIPERSTFRQPDLKQALVPYFQLTQAVRNGDLAAFHNVVNTYRNVFQKDKTITLITRLRHNVIKTGLKKINTSYSRISFADICAKLHLESVEDTEGIVAKAIRDGVINATIDHDGKFIQSKENIDIYSTQEPLAAFHRRIAFCLKTHNESVKAMRFPPDAHKPIQETAKERREREQEIAKNLAEDEEDDF